MRIATNGFGRTGRAVFRTAFERGDLEVIHLNDIAEPQTLASLLQFAEDVPIVSGDITGTVESAIVSAKDTQIIGGHFLKALAWYDNEAGFSHRCVNTMTRMV